MDDIAFALVLNLHQPAGNLEDLLDHDPWAVAEILYTLDRIPGRCGPTKIKVGSTSTASWNFSRPGKPPSVPAVGPSWP